MDQNRRVLPGKYVKSNRTDVKEGYRERSNVKRSRIVHGRVIRRRERVSPETGDQKKARTTALRKPPWKEQSDGKKAHPRRNGRSSTQQLHIRALSPKPVQQSSPPLKLRPLSAADLDDSTLGERRHHRSANSKEISSRKRFDKPSGRKSRVSRINSGRAKDNGEGRSKPRRSKKKAGSKGSPRKLKSKTLRKWSDLDPITKEMFMKPNGESLWMRSGESFQIMSKPIDKSRGKPQPLENFTLEFHSGEKIGIKPYCREQTRINSKPNDKARSRRKRSPDWKFKNSQMEFYLQPIDALSVDMRRSVRSSHQRHNSSPINSIFSVSSQSVKGEKHRHSIHRYSLSDSESLRQKLEQKRRKKSKRKKARTPKRQEKWHCTPVPKANPHQAFVYHDRFKEVRKKSEGGSKVRRDQSAKMEISVEEEKYPTRDNLPPSGRRGFGNVNVFSYPSAQKIYGQKLKHGYNPISLEGNDSTFLQQGRDHEYAHRRRQPITPKNHQKHSKESRNRSQDFRNKGLNESKQPNKGYFKDSRRSRRRNDFGDSISIDDRNLGKPEKWRSQAKRKNPPDRHTGRVQANDQGNAKSGKQRHKRRIHNHQHSKELDDYKTCNQRTVRHKLYAHHFQEEKEIRIGEANWGYEPKKSDASSEGSNDELGDAENYLPLPKEMITIQRKEHLNSVRLPAPSNIPRRERALATSGRLRKHLSYEENKEESNDLLDLNLSEHVWAHFSEESDGSVEYHEERQNDNRRKRKESERPSENGVQFYSHNNATNDKRTSRKERNNADHFERRQRVSEDIDELNVNGSPSSGSLALPQPSTFEMKGGSPREDLVPEPHVDISFALDIEILRDRLESSSSENIRDSLEIDEKVENPFLHPVRPVDHVEPEPESVSGPSNDNSQIRNDYAYAMNLLITGEQEAGPSSSPPNNREALNNSTVAQVSSDEALARRMQQELYREPNVLARPISNLREENDVPSAAVNQIEVRQERLQIINRAPLFEEINFDQMDHEDLLLLQERIGHVSRGAKQSVINELPTRRFTKNFHEEKAEGDHKDEENEMTSCCICLTEFKTTEEVRTLPCMHIFHTNCIDKWLLRNRTCPICKFDITENNSALILMCTG